MRATGWWNTSSKHRPAQHTLVTVLLYQACAAAFAISGHIAIERWTDISCQCYQFSPPIGILAEAPVLEIYGGPAALELIIFGCICSSKLYFA